MVSRSNNVSERLLDAAVGHVPFDGWSDATFQAAVVDADVTQDDARAACPRGALDLAVAYHRRGDATMMERTDAIELATMRYSERVAEFVWQRLQVVEDKELVRRGMTLFSLPQHGAEGARLIWCTADRIWNALGDTSEDINWYSKRAILSGVYSSSVLFWLGDSSPGDADTRAFVDRRIADAMRFEKFKAKAKKTPLIGGLVAGVGSALSGIKAPVGSRNRDNSPNS